MSAFRINPSRDGSAIVVIGPYDEDFVREIKQQIPPHDRQWRPVAKVWRIAKAHRTTVERILDGLDARDDHDAQDEPRDDPAGDT